MRHLLNSLPFDLCSCLNWNARDTQKNVISYENSFVWDTKFANVQHNTQVQCVNAWTQTLRISNPFGGNHPNAKSVTKYECTHLCHNTVYELVNSLLCSAVVIEFCFHFDKWRTQMTNYFAKSKTVLNDTIRATHDSDTFFKWRSHLKLSAKTHKNEHQTN